MEVEMSQNEEAVMQLSNRPLTSSTLEKILYCFRFKNYCFWPIVLVLMIKNTILTCSGNFLLAFSTGDELRVAIAAHSINNELSPRLSATPGPRCQKICTLNKVNNSQRAQTE